jgi:putative oxidoreductase
MLQDGHAAASSGVPQEGRATVSLADRVSGGNLGVLLIRLAFGLVFFGHGMQKVGWFENHAAGLPDSISSQAQFLVLGGYHHVYFLSWVLTIAELGTGLLLMLGLLTPLGVAGLVGISFQFLASIAWRGGFIGGWDNSLLFVVVGVALALFGPGRYSVDRALGWRLEGIRWGAIALILGVGVGTLVLTVFGPGLGGFTPPPGP